MFCGRNFDSVETGIWLVSKTGPTLVNMGHFSGTFKAQCFENRFLYGLNL